MMNNEIKITFRSKPVFDAAMRLAFMDEYKREKPLEVVGYRIKDNAMVLFGYEPDKGKEKEGFVKLPYPMGVEEIISFVYGWLQKTKPNYNEPDTDGSVEQGFLITTDGTDWRGGSEFWGSFIAIKPVWIVYGK
jgi:hypothetical protein